MAQSVGLVIRVIQCEQGGAGAGGEASVVSTPGAEVAGADANDVHGASLFLVIKTFRSG